MKITVQGPLVFVTGLRGKDEDFKIIVHTGRILKTGEELAIVTSFSDDINHFVSVKVNIPKEKKDKVTGKVLPPHDKDLVIPLNTYDEVLQVVETIVKNNEKTLASYQNK